MQYVALHPLHYITARYTSLHRIISIIPLSRIAWYCITLQNISLRCIALLYVLYNTLAYTTLIMQFTRTCAHTHTI